ncbi:MAG: hypothetical protein DRQ54_05555 [Gammaproteobacteria bacterium]|nr:MAG: hypothetical protein DRQ54_05555 [Gammaproteobacteria bacterium]RLA13439.1 MAG: hypothetical protein DRQ52_06240 [Gammaproteobacteria bacterium]
MEYEVKRRIYWGECDAAGIVYTPQFLNMTFQAMEHFWIDHVHIGWLDLQAETGITTPMVHVGMDFSAPARGGDEISIWIGIEKLGRSTIHYRARGMLGDQRLFMIRVISSTVDKKRFKSVEMPGVIRNKLSPLVIDVESG